MHNMLPILALSDSTEYKDATQINVSIYRSFASHTQRDSNKT